MTLFPVGKVLTKGVKVGLMEDLTSYALWNEFRRRFSDMYKEPSKVIMKDFHQIYPELLEDVRFPKFTKDYTEVITVVLIRIINTVCIYMFFLNMLLEEFVHTFILIQVILNIREYKKKLEKVCEVMKIESI